MTLRIKVFLSVLAIAGAGAGAWYAWRHHIDGGAADVLRLHGNVDIREVQLAFDTSERIARMPVEEGDRVERGQVVGELETDSLRRRVERAAARVEAQSAVVTKLGEGPRPQEIEKLRAEAEAARHRAEDAERTADRLDELARRDLAPRERADNARALARTARAELRAARESLELALEGTRAEDIEAGHARLRAERAELALAREALADATLHAPQDGVIRQRLLEPGDMAAPDRPVYTLALTDPLWVRVYVGEPDLGRIQPGMRARVHTDSFPDRGYEGWVGYISPTAEFTPKTVQTRELRTDLVYQVRVFVCNPAGELRLGMPATVTIPLDQEAAQSPRPDDHCAD